MYALDRSQLSFLDQKSRTQFTNPQFLALITPLRSIGGFPTSVAGVRQGTAVADTTNYVAQLTGCKREDAVLSIIRRASVLLDVSKTEHIAFQFNIEKSDAPFMRITESVERTPTDELTWYVITIPQQLLWHPAMTYELLAFMLLHEIGHAVDEFAENNLSSEFMADHWAAHVAFPGIFGDDGAARLRLRVATQLEDYCKGVYTTASYQSASSDRGVINSYPALHCRQMGIIDPLWMNRDKIRMNAYADTCWCDPNQISCGPVVQHSAETWQTGTCLNTLDCMPYNGGFICDSRELTESTQVYIKQLVELHRDLCLICPELCAQGSKDPLGSSPCAKDRHARKFLRLLRASQKEIDVIRGIPKRH